MNDKSAVARLFNKAENNMDEAWGKGESRAAGVPLNSVETAKAVAKGTIFAHEFLKAEGRL